MVRRPLRGDAGTRRTSLQGSGHLSGRDLARLPAPGVGISRRPRSARAAARQPGRRHGGSLLGILDLRHGRAVRRCGLLRHLHDLLGQRSRIPARKRRRRFLLRGKSGIRRQAAEHGKPRTANSQDHRLRYAGNVSIYRRAPDQLRRSSCARPRAPGGNAEPANFPRRTGGGRAGGGYRRSRLYLGHDRGAKRRDARSRLADVGICQFLSGSVSRTQHRRASRGSAPADGAPHRALDVDLLAAGRRDHSAYRRGGRRSARHALRSSADVSQCRAAHPRKDRIAGRNRDAAQLAGQAADLCLGDGNRHAPPSSVVGGAPAWPWPFGARCACRRDRFPAACCARSACRKSRPFFAPARRCR